MAALWWAQAQRRETGSLPTSMWPVSTAGRPQNSRKYRLPNQITCSHGRCVSIPWSTKCYKGWGNGAVQKTHHRRRPAAAAATTRACCKPLVRGGVAWLPLQAPESAESVGHINVTGPQRVGNQEPCARRWYQ
jgi:hypothetical protein